MVLLYCTGWVGGGGWRWCLTGGHPNTTGLVGGVGLREMRGCGRQVAPAGSRD